MQNKLIVGWRVLCADCGVNCDLHHCYVDSECELHDESLEDECRNEGTLLCSECITKREEENDEIE